MPYKGYILEKCDACGDNWANEVCVNVFSTVSNLHAAEARYHKDCMSRFLSNRVKPTGKEDDPQQTIKNQELSDLAWKYVMKVMPNGQK